VGSDTILSCHREQSEAIQKKSMADCPVFFYLSLQSAMYFSGSLHFVRDDGVQCDDGEWCNNGE
jgi:hypothetical protein